MWVMARIACPACLRSTPMNTTPNVIYKNRYELDQMADRLSAFVESYPSFNQTLLLDEWREAQYNRLDANGQIYLDYTGGGLYSDSQLCDHMELLRTSVLGNHDRLG
jgi:hypothetical protein